MGAATPSRAGSPACSRRTPRSGRSCWSTGPPATRRDGLGGDLDDDLAWQPPLWRALTGRSARRSRPSGTPPPLERLRAGTVRPAAAHLAVRPHPDAGDRDRAAACARHPPRPPPVAAAPQRPTCGSGSRDLEGPTPRRLDDSHRRVRHPLLASLGRDQRELQRSLGAGDHGTDVEVATTTLARDPARLAPGRPARRRRPSRGPCPRRPRPVGPGAPLPRPGASGPGAPRGAARAPRGRPDPRAARHPRDVPRHRELRAADHRGVRAR